MKAASSLCNFKHRSLRWFAQERLTMLIAAASIIGRRHDDDRNWKMYTALFYVIVNLRIYCFVSLQELM